MLVLHVVRSGLSEVHDLDGGSTEIRACVDCSCGWGLEEGSLIGDVSVLDLRWLRLLGQLHRDSGKMGLELLQLAEARGWEPFQIAGREPRLRELLYGTGLALDSLQ